MRADWGNCMMCGKRIIEPDDFPPLCAAPRIGRRHSDGEEGYVCRWCLEEQCSRCHGPIRREMQGNALRYVCAADCTKEKVPEAVLSVTDKRTQRVRAK